MRLFIVLLSWFVGYFFTLVSIAKGMIREKKDIEEAGGVWDGDKESSTFANTAWSCLLVWPVVGSVMASCNLANRYCNKSNKE